MERLAVYEVCHKRLLVGLERSLPAILTNYEPGADGFRVRQEGTVLRRSAEAGWW